MSINNNNLTTSLSLSLYTHTHPCTHAHTRMRGWVKEKEGEELVHAISTITRRTTSPTFAKLSLLHPTYAEKNASQHVRTCAMPYPRVAA